MTLAGLALKYKSPFVDFLYFSRNLESLNFFSWKNTLYTPLL